MHFSSDSRSIYLWQRFTSNKYRLAADFGLFISSGFFSVLLDIKL